LKPDNWKLVGRGKRDVERHSILVVDDRPTLWVLSSIIGHDGYEFFFAEKGPVAIPIIASRSVDLVFLDVALPGQDGIDVLVEMKRVRPDVPVIMVSPTEDERQMYRAFENGAFSFLVKPIDPAGLRWVAGKALKLSQLAAMHP
jgi:DNA-binding NtrC family response regulator